MIKYMILIAMIALAACTQQATQQIASFEECVAAGNPVMESYPRQCRAEDGTLFVEEIDDINESPSGETQFDGKFTQCVERPEVCTMEYNPVCALRDNGIRCVTEPCPSFDAVNMGNACTACGDENILGHYPGSCEENTFVICEVAQTGFNITQIAKESDWICVDVCPNNYDPYGTQIGAQMCIKHYGIEEISEWEICEASTSSCDCVKAYETTDNQPIENPEFRCVPDQYRERLLFRSGVEKLDEEGQASVAIA